MTRTGGVIYRRTNMKKYLIVIAITICMILTLFGCESWERGMVDLKSEFGGLDRIIRVYTANGEIIAEYEGKIDIAVTDGGYVKFDHDG
jgi:hypothetical protein